MFGCCFGIEKYSTNIICFLKISLTIIFFCYEYFQKATVRIFDFKQVNDDYLVCILSVHVLTGATMCHNLTAQGCMTCGRCRNSNVAKPR